MESLAINTSATPFLLTVTRTHAHPMPTATPDTHRPHSHTRNTKACAQLTHLIYAIGCPINRAARGRATQNPGSKPWCVAASAENVRTAENDG